MLDSKTGIITGYRNEILSLYSLKITCKNEINEMSDRISISVAKNEIKNMSSMYGFYHSVTP